MAGPVVYRVQDARGKGPFQPGFSRHWVEDRTDEECRALLPFPLEFGPVHHRVLYGEWAGSACRTLDQLRRWFRPSEYATLRAYGYRAVGLEAGRILAEGPTQCFFARARPLEEDVWEVPLYGKGG